MKKIVKKAARSVPIPMIIPLPRKKRRTTVKGETAGDQVLILARAKEEKAASVANRTTKVVKVAKAAKAAKGITVRVLILLPCQQVLGEEVIRH